MSISHQQFSDWYNSVGSRIDAGIGLVEAIEETGSIGKSSTDWFVDGLRRGSSIDDVLRSAPDWFPERDRFLISAAAESGKLSQAFILLSETHEEMEDNLRQWKQVLVYPVLMIHAVIFAQPLIGMVNLELSLSQLAFWYAQELAPWLIGFWAIWLLLGYFLKKSDNSKYVLARFIPGLGTFFRYQAYFNFASTMESFLEAGISFEESLAAAGLVSDNKHLKEKAFDSLDLIRKGKLPSIAFEETKLLPKSYLNYYQAGEKTGTQPKQLAKIANDAKRRSLEAIKRMRFWYPKLILGLIMVIVAYKTLSGFNAYLEGILEMLDS